MNNSKAEKIRDGIYKDKGENPVYYYLELSGKVIDESMRVFPVDLNEFLDTKVFVKYIPSRRMFKYLLEHELLEN